MRYSIEKESKIPAYLQLYRQIRDDIIAGVYPPDSKLPSKRMLSEETGVSIITSEHAYALLCEEGYLEARQRSGYFVTFHTDDGFAAPSFYPKHPVVPHHHTEVAAAFPFSVLTRTMRSVISDYGKTILDRSPNAGIPELRRAIQLYLARSRGIHTTSKQIIIGSGAEYLYGLIVELLGRDKTYAIETPSYKKIEQVYLAANVTLEKLPLGTDGIDSDALRNCTADILHISPYRSYPSGVTASASKRHEYIRWANKGCRYLVEDDFESEFSISKKPEETLFSLSAENRVIYMNTFSKTISPSFRTGYMVLPLPLAERFEAQLGFYSCTVPTYTQYVLAELLSNGAFERHINRVRRTKRREQKEK